MSPRLGARFVLPFLGLAAVLLLWAVVSQTVAADLPSPWKTWLESKRYILEPFFQFRRPISPLAGLPLGLVVFQKSEPAAIFTIALCAMWPTVINTAVGVRGISQDYLNVGRVLKLSRERMLTKIVIPATLPYVFTGYRLSLGLAWLVIVAAEMLTGTPGVGGFLWQEYNSLVYSHIILSVITIGAIGFVLDRLMGLVEARFKTT